MDKILSIIIPTYNMERYLHRCLDSIIIEDKILFYRLEVLVVNDGSKDSSSAIAHEYEMKYPEVIRVIDKDNGNYGSCFNRGLKEATGSYVKLLDADDYYDTRELINFIKELMNTDADLIISSFNIVDETTIITSSNNVPADSKGTSILVDNNNLFNILPQKLIAMHSIAIKRENLIENCYKQQEGISYTDTEYSFFGVLYAKKVYFSSSCLYQYYVGREGQTVSISSQINHKRDYVLILNRLLDVLIEKQLTLSLYKKEILLYIVTSLFKLYSVVSILAIPPRKIEETTILEILDKCEQCGIQLSGLMESTKYHGIPYLKLWVNHRISFYPLFKFVTLLKRYYKPL